MKIKEICARTGLTDRTVRFYIEEGLIAPAYTENYLGRRTFDFSEEDVESLSDVAVLREFDFSIEEIRRILSDPENSREVIASVRERTEMRREESQHQCEVLEVLDPERTYTVSEIACLLSKAGREPISLLADARKHGRLARAAASGVRATVSLAAILASPVLGGVFVGLGFLRYAHPVVDPLLFSLLILLCAPSLFALVSLFFSRIQRYIPTRVLLTVCLCAIPLSALLGTFSVSECTHTRREFTTEMAASCTEAGVVYGVCERCGAGERVPTDPTGHTPVTDPAVSPTCTAQGRSEGSHCAVCGEVFRAQEILERLAHTPVNVPAVAPNCTANGFGEGTVCSACGEILKTPALIPSLGHAPVHQAAVAPTCTTGGLTEGTHCERCQVRLAVQTVIPPLGHIPVELAPIAPTCTERGYTEASMCERDGCGMMLSLSEPIPATGHTPVVDHGFKPTCRREGLSDGSHCSSCGEILLAGEVLPPTHTALVEIEGRPATCTQFGKVGYTYCEACGEQVGEGGDYLPMLSHDDRLVESVSATCDTDGYEKYRCKDCGRERRERLVCPDLEHTFVTTPQFGDGECSACGLVVCLWGNADGSWSGGNEAVKYYITGATDDESPRTLVIWGEGAMTNFRSGDVWYPRWAGESFETVIIKKGVTRLGKYAFDDVEGEFHYNRVKKFIVEDPTLPLHSMSGIKCRVTWGNDLNNARAGSEYIHYLKTNEDPYLSYAITDLDGDGSEEMIVRAGETWEIATEYYLTCNEFGMPVDFYPFEPVDTTELSFYVRDDFSGFYEEEILS